MMTNPFRKFAFKLTFYSLFLLYIVGDLYVWDGYLSGRFRAHFKPMDNPFNDNSDAIALVYGEPITRNQLERRKAEIAYTRGWRRGWDSTSSEVLTPQQQETLRIQAMYDLVEAALLRLKTRTNDMRLPDQGELSGRYFKELRARFPEGEQAFLEALHVQELTDKELADKITARLKQQAMLVRSIDESVPVSDTDLKVYYDRVREKIKVPRHRTLKHIFKAGLHHDSSEVKKKMEAVAAELQSGVSFSDLAARHSEDTATARKGGELGVVTADRKDLLKGVDLFALPDGEPVLVESPLGWHIFQAGPVVEERIPSFEEAKPTLKSALESVRRDRAASLYADELRREAHAKKRIIVSDAK